MLRDPRLRLAFIVTLVMSFIILWRVRSEDGVLMVVALVIVMAFLQGVALFWNRPSGSSLHQARQLYMRAAFREAIQVLEADLAESASPDVEALALLGNTHRQLNQMDESLAYLERAVEVDSTNHLALFGLGRTLMVRGAYAQAAEYIEAAMIHGAPKTVQGDLVLAYYYADAPAEKVLDLAQKAAGMLRLQPYRRLIVSYVIYRLVQNEQEQTRAKQVMQANADALGYWQSQAKRYADVAYGKRMAADVLAIQTLVYEDKE